MRAHVRALLAATPSMVPVDSVLNRLAESSLSAGERFERRRAALAALRGLDALARGLIGVGATGAVGDTGGSVAVDRWSRWCLFACSMLEEIGACCSLKFYAHTHTQTDRQSLLYSAPLRY
jgi:hypothetical protein